MSLLTGIDFGFLKDDGFRKWGLAALAVIGLFYLMGTGNMDVPAGMEYVLAILIAYGVINVGSKFLAAKSANSKPPDVVS